MDCKEEIEDDYAPPEVLEAAEVSTTNPLPAKSKAKYELVYKDFMDWRKLKNINSFSENILLAYFGELSTKYKSSSLWSRYSMLRSTLTINHSINIEKYSRLRAFLKRKSDGYHAKKAKPFTPDEINKFFNDAPDNTFLATKVALIMGITGACRPGELHSMDIKDVQDLGSTLVVTIPSRKTKVAREFTITDNFYQICKKYADLRPTNAKCCTSFFVNYQNGKCTAQKVGINKFSTMGKQIATFLKLPHPEMYSGHSFRRSSASLLEEAGGNITDIKRHGGWNSATVAEGYIDNLVKNEINTATIFQSVYHNDQKPDIKIEDTSSTTPVPIYPKETITMSATPGISLHNCSNVTVNVTYITLQSDKK